MLTSSLAVAAGGAIGSLARFWLAELFVALGMVVVPVGDARRQRQRQLPDRPDRGA